MRRVVLAAAAVGALFVLAAVLGREAAAEPFALERRPVERIQATSGDALADAIVAQLPYRERAAAPSARATSMFNAWIDLMRLTVYRDQTRGTPLAPERPLWLAAGGIGGEDRANRAYLTAAEDVLRRLVRANARRVGMRLLVISFLHPEGIPVPVALLRAPPELVRRSGGSPLGASAVAGAEDDTRSLGWYADVVDERGDWVQSQGLVPAAGSGTFATRFPRADACGGPVACVVHG